MSESRLTVDEPLVYKAPSSDRAYVRLNHALFALAACLSVILPLIALLMLQVLALREEVAVMRTTVNNLSEQRNLIQDLVAFEDEVYAEDEIEGADDDYYDSLSDTDGKQDKVKKEKPQPFQSNSFNFNFSMDDIVGDSVGGDAADVKDSIKDYHSRKVRETGLGHRAPIPIITESYGIGIGRANSSEGLKLYESLSSNGRRIPKKHINRVNTVWSSKPSLKKYSPPTDIPLLTRQSRVMQTDSSSSGVPLIVPYIPSGQHETKYQEQKASPVTVVHSGGKNRQRRLKTERINPALETLDEQTTSRPTRTRQLVVAHYHGDTSRYSTDHPYYDGNGRLRHPDGIFTDWVASSWMNQLGMNRHFTLQQGGTVTIRTSGVYYIYAQIYYVDEHDTNGYRVYVNNIPVLQCTTSTSHVPNTSQSNTCHSTTLHYLNQSDQLSIRDVEGLRYSLFEPAKSFFGLIKMGDATIK